MGLETYLTDPKNHNKAHIFTHNDKDDNNGLVVATHPLKQYENKLKFFTSGSHGIDMNIGMTVTYTENINDGADNTYWTASIISGAKWDINSNDQNHTGGGSSSIKYDNGDVNDVLQITDTADFNLINYDTLTIWVYVDKDWNDGDSIVVYGWDTGTGLIVGGSVNLEDYFTWNIFNTWHKLSIPLTDMALIGETLDAIRIEIISNEGKSPKMYIDDIQFTGTGGTIGEGEYLIEPDPGTWYYVYRLSITVADAYSGILTVAGATENATIQGLSYDQILGEASLDTGIVYQKIQDGEVKQTFSIKNIGDYLQFPTARISSLVSDGTNTFLSMDSDFIEPVILKHENRDKLRIIISDNLSGLLLLRIAVGGKEEQRGSTN